MMIIVMMVSYCVPAAWARETVHSPFAQKIKNCAKVTFFKNLSNDKLLKTINGGHESARSWMQAGSLHVFFRLGCSVGKSGSAAGNHCQ